MGRMDHGRDGFFHLLPGFVPALRELLPKSGIAATQPMWGTMVAFVRVIHDRVGTALIGVDR